MTMTAMKPSSISPSATATSPVEAAGRMLTFSTFHGHTAQRAEHEPHQGGYRQVAVVVEQPAQQVGERDNPHRGRRP